MLIEPKSAFPDSWSLKFAGAAFNEAKDANSIQGADPRRLGPKDLDPQRESGERTTAAAAPRRLT